MLKAFWQPCPLLPVTLFFKDASGCFRMLQDAATITDIYETMPDENATRQLKGILGMISSENITSAHDSEVPVSASKNSESTPKQIKSKKNKGKKSSFKSKPSSTGDNSNELPNDAAEKLQHSIPPKSHKDQTKSRKKKKKKKGSDNSSRCGDSSANFACSAAFVAPDASTLPLPVFGSKSFEEESRKELARSSKRLHSSQTEEQEEGGGIDAVETCQDTNKTKMQNKNVTSSITTAGDIKAILKISDVEDGRRHNSSNRNAFLERKHGASMNNNNTSEEVKVPIDKTNSIGGVDLAALMLNDSDDKKKVEGNSCDIMNECSKKDEERIDPLTMLMNPSYGLGTSHTNSSQVQQYSSPYHHNHQLHGSHYYHHPGPQNPYSMPLNLPPNALSHGYAAIQSHSHHSNLGMYQPTHHPHQGFVTLQVQVPKNLLPGRQMTVPTPSGYNFPVIVPEGVHPGASVPVVIPAFYMNIHGTAPILYSQSQLQHQSQLENQSRSKSSTSTSWAAKAAASPQNSRIKQ